MIIFDPNWGLYTSNHTSTWLYYLKQFINIIQMPIFIMISGYLFNVTLAKSKYRHVFDLIKDKFSRLLIPFFFISILWLVPVRFLAHYSGYQDLGYIGAVKNALLGVDSGHLWFLPTLFMLFVFTYLLQKIGKNTKFKSLIILFALLGLNVIAYRIKNIFFISMVATYWFYFYFGFYIANKNITPMIDWKVVIATFFYMISSIMIVFCVQNIIIENVLCIIAALTGTYMFYCLMFLVKSNKIIQLIDKNSFAIYLLHSPIIYCMYHWFANISPIFLVMANMIVAISIPMIIAAILRKIKLNGILGEKIKKEVKDENISINANL